MEIPSTVTWAIAGTLVSLFGVLLAGFARHFEGSRKEREVSKALETAKRRVTEVGLNLAGISISHRIDHDASPELDLTEQLVKEIKEDIAARVSLDAGISEQELKRRVDENVTELRARLERIEDRFPEDSSIERISSLNDALFAERIDQLSLRIDALEGRLLTKWDVALVVSAVLAGVFAVVGATYSVLSVIGLVSVGP